MAVLLYILPRSWYLFSDSEESPLTPLCIEDAERVGDPILFERPCNPEGLEVILKCVLHEPRRARGDDEASVARSAARGAYRHHHSTQHCAAHGAEGINTRLNIVHRRCTQLGPETRPAKCLAEEL